MPTDYSSIGSEKLLERRLDYAWKYFDGGAQKRMQFVNYFVILVGILANAYVAAAKDNNWIVAFVVCLFGLLAAITFMMLDYRMLLFVDRSLAVLETLEREVLFPNGYFRMGPRGETQQQLGLARLEPDESAKSSRLRRILQAATKVKVWVRFVVEGGAGLAFAVGAGHAAKLLGWL